MAEQAISETPVLDDKFPYADTERVWIRRAIIVSIVLAIIAVPLSHRYLLWLIYLQPVGDEWQIGAAFRSKISLAVGVAVAAIPWAWWAGIKLDLLLKKVSVPWAALFSLTIIVAGCLLLSTSRATWFFVEWVKVRTPNPSFARNTLFWEHRNFESVAPKNSIQKVGLVGSSQTYQGFDLNQLKSERPEIEFEKNTLAGFGPMQYPFVLPRICERNFDQIVCQLSEFDFFREDNLPVNRLRWGATAEGVTLLAGSLTKREQFRDRGGLADVSFASICPLWRQRDHFRRTAFGYWWKKSDPLTSDDNNVTPKLADAPALIEAIEFLKRNVTADKQMVDANFRSFETFAKQVSERGISLVVIEGQVHPAARAAYDVGGSMQMATRDRLSRMAKDLNFTYVDSDAMPAFTAEDFSDAYHLNPQGRAKLTSFLADQLQPEN